MSGGRRSSARTLLAWHNLEHRRGRAAVALAGVCFAILLLFVQLGFYGACYRSATLIHDLLDFDAVLVSPQYVFLVQPGTIPGARAHQAAAVPGVAGTARLRVATVTWRNTANRNFYEVLVLGVEPDERPFRVPELNEQVPGLARLETGVFDQVANPVLGPVAPGTTSELGGQRLEVIGGYRWGSGFLGNATVVVGRSTFARLYPDLPLDAPGLVLLRFEPSADRGRVLADLRRAMPVDTVVLEREALKQQDQVYFMLERPTGLLFISGVVLAVLVGGVILFQVLASEIAQQIGELATLKAMGYTTGQLRRLVLEQGLLYGSLGFAPALVLSLGIYALVRATARMPIAMTLERLALVAMLSLLMCAASALLAARKLDRADPAELF